MDITAQKFYAVKKGVKQGVYKDWDACKANVAGVSNAVYKSFKTEAEAWAFLGVKVTRPAAPPPKVASVPSKPKPAAVPKPAPPKAAPAATTTATKPTNTNDLILSLRDRPINYTTDQAAALRAVAEFADNPRRNHFVMAGFAGTGKTTILENIARYASKKKLTPILAAPTNRAVRVLSSKINGDFDRKTLHALLYGAPDDEGRWVPKVDFTRDQLVIVDEASMIGLDVYDDLMPKIREAGAKAVFVGDSYQLQPVSRDPRILTRPDALMRQVMRQAAESGILTLATAVRTLGKKIMPATDADDVTIKTATAALKGFFKDIKEADQEAVYICGKNDTRILVNETARRQKYGNAISDRPQGGDQIICISNGPNVNGEAMTVTDIDEISDRQTISLLVDGAAPGQREIKTERAILCRINGLPTIFLPWTVRPSVYHGQIVADKKVFGEEWITKNKKSGKTELNRSAVNIATFGYALTAHKSQGGQWAKVYVEQDAFIGNSRWYYTAITRAADELVLIQDPKAAPMTWEQMQKLIGI